MSSYISDDLRHMVASRADALHCMRLLDLDVHQAIKRALVEPRNRGNMFFEPVCISKLQ